MPGPSTPGQAALTKKQLSRTKTTTNAAASFEGPVSATEKYVQNGSQHIYGPLKGLAWVVGQSGPSFVNRGNRAIRALKRYGG
jgi:hypothetical protein